MRFSQFCDMAENTEQEQQFFQFLKQDFVQDPMREHSAKLKCIPIIGKVLTAIFALAKSENIAEFRQSRHYRHLMNWDVKFDGNNLEINTSDVQKKKVLKILAVIGAVLAILVICRKCCCRKK